MGCKQCIGETCSCNRGEPCLLSYQVDCDTRSVSFVSGGLMSTRILKAMDKGSGADITVSLEGFCESNSAQCPTGYITDHKSYAEGVSIGQCQPYRLHYQSNKEFGLLDAIRLMLAENKLTRLPSTTYQLCITQCAGKPQQEYTIRYTPLFTRILGELSNDCFIEVYPETKIESKLTLSYDSKSEKVSDDVRYKEYFERMRNGTHQGEAIPEKEISRSFSLEGSLAIKQGSTTTTYASGLETRSSNFTYDRNLQDTFDNIVDQWRLINGIINIIKQIKSGTYQSSGRDKVKLVTFKLGKPKVTLEGTQTYELTDSAIETSGEIALKFDPLFQFEITLDLVLAAAAYFGVKSAVAEIREQAQKLEDKVKAGQAGAYVGAEFFVRLSSTLSTEGTVKRNIDAPTEYGLSAVTSVALSSEANVRGGAKVWNVEGAFQVTGQIKAECLLAIRSKTDGEDSSVELVFFHKGIKAKVSIKISGSIESNKSHSSQGDGSLDAFDNENTTTESTFSYTEEEEWAWVPELKEADSPHKVTLIGNEA